VRSLPAWLARLLGRAVPGLPAALVEVMLSDLPPSPCRGRHARPVRHPPAARRRCLAPRGFHRDAAVSEEELRAPYELGTALYEILRRGRLL
jgi:hypothetical protein